MTVQEQLAVVRRVARNLADFRTGDVDDMVQDGMLAILRAPFDGRGDEQGHVACRARNGIVDELRRRRVYSRVHRTVTVTFVGVHGEGAAAFRLEAEQEHACARRLQGERVRAAIATLPAHERTIIDLVFYQDQPQRAACAVIGVKEARVSQLLTRAKRRLRALLADERTQCYT